MTVMKCAAQDCDWTVQQDETWDEKAEEHMMETNHTIFLSKRGVDLPEDQW